MSASQVLARYWERRGAPVDPFEIASAAGVSVQPLASYETASGWYKNDNSVPCIMYNAREPRTRVRFTIAHELGHHFLGHGSRPRDTANAFNIYNPDYVEVAANQFAAELLMPSAYVNGLVNQGWTSIARLASAFDVSEVAMNYRLQNLGLVS